MWKCTHCNEESEENFDACWKCGTARNGSAAPDNFAAEREGASRGLDSEFAERFKCCKCNHTVARVKRIGTTGTGLSKLMDIQHNTFIAVSCGRCGYTEFYNSEVLEGNSCLGSVLDGLFG